jgi:hypothetical protein
VIGLDHFPYLLTHISPFLLLSRVAFNFYSLFRYLCDLHVSFFVAMRSWNRRGFTLCTSAVALIVLLSTTLLLFPNTFQPNTRPVNSIDLDWAPWKDVSSSPSTSAPPEIPKPKPPTRPPIGGWTFDPKRDERNFGLSDDQCSAAFPDFYAEIDRAVQYRKEKGLGNVTSDLVDIGWRDNEIMRAMIYDKQVLNIAC